MAEDVDAEPAERIEELETQVAELEATVRGLTEELVDRTERVRQLESQVGVDAVDGGDLAGGDTPEPETEESAEATAEAPAEGAKGSGDEEDSNGEESGEGDDIIVA
jgi:TolA-binding protein